MGCQEIGSWSKNSECFHSSNVTVLEVNEPIRYAGIDYSGNHFLQVHGLAGYPDVCEDPAGYGVSKTFIVADQLG